jgi:hypothetical protein
MARRRFNSGTNAIPKAPANIVMPNTSRNPPAKIVTSAGGDSSSRQTMASGYFVILLDLPLI